MVPEEKNEVKGGWDGNKRRQMAGRGENVFVMQPILTFNICSNKKKCINLRPCKIMVVGYDAAMASIRS